MDYERVSLSFAVLNLILVTGLTLVYAPKHYGTDNSWLETLCIMLSVLSIMYGVLLLGGLIQRKAQFVKQYFAFGAVTQLLFIIAIIFYTVSGGDLLIITGAFLGCLAYKVLLYVIFKTYKKFEKEAKRHEDPNTINEGESFLESEYDTSSLIHNTYPIWVGP